jgi:hypothetical protein
MTTHSVDPARLHWGTWCHRVEKILGEGDIAASYSAESYRHGRAAEKALWFSRLALGMCEPERRKG